jgi:hypothetical protein
MKKIIMGILLSMFAASVMAEEEKPEALTAKHFQIVPFCSVATGEKLDPKSKDIFDELKVSVTAGRQTRYRISGKKKQEAGNLGGRPVLHTGKLVLVPFGKRTGKVIPKLPTLTDVRFYFMCVELPQNKLQTKNITLEKGVDYTWSAETKDGKAIFQVLDGTKVVDSITVPENQAMAFGFAATVRWKDNEADLAVEFDGAGK